MEIYLMAYSLVKEQMAAQGWAGQNRLMLTKQYTNVDPTRDNVCVSCFGCTGWQDPCLSTAYCPEDACVPRLPDDCFHQRTCTSPQQHQCGGTSCQVGTAAGFKHSTAQHSTAQQQSGRSTMSLLSVYVVKVGYLVYW